MTKPSFCSSWHLKTENIIHVYTQTKCITTLAAPTMSVERPELCCPNWWFYQLSQWMIYQNFSVLFSNKSTGTFMNSKFKPTIFMNNFIYSSHVPMACSIMQVSPVVIVTRWRHTVAVEILGLLVLLCQNIRTTGVVLTPHQTASFYTHCRSLWEGKFCI